MPRKKAGERPKRLSEKATRRTGRLPDEKHAERARVIEQVEKELGDRIKKASPARIVLAKLNLARRREGLTLAEMAERTGIDRGNLSRLENNVEDVELNTLARMADAIVVDLRKRT